tara:strand:+ start:94 stop:792 length:699 start_codon:yes stop_codon:yes gene_type:complete
MLHRGIFLRRYKRFFAEIYSDSGEILTLHCPNTGSLKNCLIESSPCLYSLSSDKKRKLKGTLEFVTTKFDNLAGINSASANKIVASALNAKIVQSLEQYDIFFKEVKFGDENSRLDFRLQNSKNLLPDCFLEVKSATYDIGNGIVLFPDSVTSRGAKHLRELIKAVDKGYRAVLFFCVQVSNSKMLKIADDIDPHYADTLYKAVTAGVEIKTWNTNLSGHEVTLRDQIEFSY